MMLNVHIHCRQNTEFFKVLNRVVRIVICASKGLIIQFKKGEKSFP